MNRFIFIALILLCGCANVKNIEKSITVTGFDFTEYAKENFLITTESYNGEYISVGLITSTITPEVKESSYGEQKDGYKVAWGANKAFHIQIVDPTEAIKEMHKVALEMGANGIIRFTTSTTYIDNGAIKIPCYEVSGLAIKRK